MKGLIIAALSLALLLVSPEVFGQVEEEEGNAKLPLPIHDCRYSPRDLPTKTPRGDLARSFEHLGFPRDDVFRPLLAAPTEPRFSGTFGWASYEPELSRGNGLSNFISIFVGLAGSAGLWTFRDRRFCDGVQLNIFGGAFSQFALNPLHLLNIDYQGGLAVTGSRGDFSARLRVYHQSSHLGDDFLIANPDFSTQTMSFEALDFVAAMVGSWWRIYAGGGWYVRVDPGELGRGSLRLGMELRSEVWERPAPFSNMHWAPLFGTDLLSHQARQWGLTSNTMMGAELVSQKNLRRFRVVATFLHGYTPYGYFFQDHRVTSPGLEVHFVY